MSTELNEFEAYAQRERMELTFSNGHRFYGRIYYDYLEGKYYDCQTDLYLDDAGLKSFRLA